MGDMSKKEEKEVLLQKEIIEKYALKVCLIQSGYFPKNDGSLYTQVYHNVRISSENGENRVQYDVICPDLAFTGHGKSKGSRGADTDARVNSGMGAGPIGVEKVNEFELSLNDSIFVLAPFEQAKPEDLEKMLEHLVKKPKQLVVRDILPFFPKAISVW